MDFMDWLAEFDEIMASWRFVVDFVVDFDGICPSFRHPVRCGNSAQPSVHQNRGDLWMFISSFTQRMIKNDGGIIILNRSDPLPTEQRTLAALRERYLVVF